MKVKIIFLIGLMIGVGRLMAQEDVVDKLTVPLSQPNEPVFLELSLMNGSITVTGYSGNQVEIEAVTKLKKLDREEPSKKEREGLIHIPTTSSALEVEEFNNKIEIDVESLKKTVDVNLKVPYQTSLDLSAHHNGIIKVDNVIGDLEVQNHHGPIYLTDISGSVVANSHHGEITVTFKQIDPKKPMAFSSYHGDIDVSLPASVKANVMFKTEQGEVYSDFEIKKSEEESKRVQERTHDQDGKYQVRIERAFYGAINGGGPEFQFSNYHGDIILRKNRQ
jgi:DUF4097 and DUF4098 domain-containing protein YvlB